MFEHSAVQSVTLGQRLADTIKDAIIHAQLMPGQRLYEQELSKSLGVSRTPLREALQHLIADGWVTRLPGGGVEVSRPSRDQAVHIYQVRAVIEGLIVREVAEKLTDEQIAVIEQLTEEMERCAERGDPKATLAAGDRVHRFLRELSGNRVAVDILEELHDRIEHYRNLTVLASGRLKEAAQGHRTLCAALAARDPDLAEAAIRADITRAGRFLIEHYGAGEA